MGVEKEELPGVMMGIVLAGGRSRRAGVNKSLLKIGQKRLIERVVDALAEIFDDVLIVTNAADEYRFLGRPMVADLIPGMGALGGIYTGLKSSSSHQSFFVACDMPFLSSGLLSHMAREADGYDVVIPRVSYGTRNIEGYQPLHAIYSRACIPHIEALLGARRLRIIDFFHRVRVKEIPEDVVRQYDPYQCLFFNINVMSDVEKAEALCRKLEGRSSA